MVHSKFYQSFRVLNISANKINTLCTSTESVPNTIPTCGSTGADFSGPAVIEACETIVKRLAPFKENNPDGKWEDWVLAAFLNTVSLSATGYYGGMDANIAFDTAANAGKAYHYYGYVAVCVMVEVDCHTGDFTLLSTDLVMDAGKSLNPALDIGQMEGGFMQGMGWATMEQLLISPKTG